MEHKYEDALDIESDGKDCLKYKTLHFVKFKIHGHPNEQG